MRFTKKDSLYRISRITGSQDNILGVSFDEDDKNNIDIEIIEWAIGDGAKILASKSQVLNQVLYGLKLINQSLGTSYKLSKIYFLSSDSPSCFVYSLLIYNLIRHYHNGKEFEVSPN